MHTRILIRINTSRILLVLACESSSAFPRRDFLLFFFAITGNEVHPTAHNSLIVLADPCSAYSAKLRATSAVPNTSLTGLRFFQDSMLFESHVFCFFVSMVHAKRIKFIQDSVFSCRRQTRIYYKK